MKKLNEILGTEFPIIQGGMANIATGEFAAACSNAGALGLVAGGGLDGESLRAQIRRAKELTDKPFGVNLMLMNPHIDDCAKVVVEEGVQVVTTGAGNPAKYVESFKEAGIRIFPVVAAPHSGQAPGAPGQSTASSPRAPSLAVTWARPPRWRSSRPWSTPVDLPVIAAGGIADGRGMAAAFALGACGVQGGHLPARERGVPHPRQLQGEGRQGGRERHRRDRSPRGRSGFAA